MLATIIKNLPDVDFSDRRHKKIMRRVRFLKWRQFFLLAMILLFLNLTVVGAQVWFKLAENDVVAGVVNLWIGFEVSFDFVSDLVQIVFDSVPVWQVINVFFDAVALAAVAIFYFRLNQGQKVFRNI